MDYSSILRQLQPWEMPATGIAVLLLAIWNAVLHRHLSRFTHRLERLRRSRGVLEIERTLEEQAASVEEARKQVDSFRRELGGCLQNVGMVRFNAFGEAGSDLSFSVALMNAGGDGLVITGLWGREESRVFAKPVLEGKSSYPLSKEEEEAIATARRRTEG